MLRIALSEVRSGAVETNGEIAPDDALLATPGVTLLEPLVVSGRFSSAGGEKYYWKAAFHTVLRLECRRCLAPVELPLRQTLGLVFSASDDTPEGDGVYLIPPRTQLLDLTEAVREEFLLAVPHFVECRPECKGLCARCGANLNDGPCGCGPQTDPRWDALGALTMHPKKD